MIDLGEHPIEHAELLGAPHEMVGKQGHLLLRARIDQGGRTLKIRVRDQGGRPMSERPRGGKLDPCPATCSTTATSRMNAAPSSNETEQP
jgi:hypothetical protein